MIFAALLFGVVPGVQADEFDFRFGVEHFRWREYDGGTRLLEEKGPRVHLGVDWKTPLQGNNLFLDLSGTLYLGRVDYDGQACSLGGSCTPFNADADYLGVQARGLFARRFGDASGLELFGGGGFDAWQRDIQGHGGVSGATENWYVFYLAGGVGGYWGTPTTRGSARIGIKYPLYTEEYPDTYDVTLNPEGQVSPFAEVKFDFMSGGRRSWGLGFYYETYRFAESDKERDGSVVIWQPKSHQETIGVFATIPLR
jgi:hypothetical protein